MTPLGCWQTQDGFPGIGEQRMGMELVETAATGGGSGCSQPPGVHHLQYVMFITFIVM